MKRTTIIKVAVFAAILTGVACVYFARTGNRLSAGLATTDESYFFGWSEGEGPRLEPDVLRRSKEIEEVVLHTVVAQVGIEPLYLRLRSDGSVTRCKTSLSDYTMYDRSVEQQHPVTKTVEVATATTRDFARFAYLIAGLPYRSLPISPKDEPIFGASIEVVKKGGTRETFYFMNPPPEFWIIVEGLYHLADVAQWEVIETKQSPTRR